MKSAEDIRRYFRESTLSTNWDRHEAIFEKVLRAQEQSGETTPAAYRRINWSCIMRSPLTKLAAAAVVLIACVIGLSLWRTTGSGIALAEVLARLEQVQSVRSKYTFTANSEMTPGKPSQFEIRGTSLTSREYGFTITNEMSDPNGGWKPLGGFYASLSKRTLVQTGHAKKVYVYLGLDDARAQQMRKNLEFETEPGAILKDIMACKHEKLGRSTLDGIEVEVFRTTDPNCRFPAVGERPKNSPVDVKVWVDVKTRLPVRTEALFPGRDRLGNTISQRLVGYDYEWDFPVTAADFDPPPLPADYTVVHRENQEESAIQGLRQSVELLGSYPKEGEQPDKAIVRALQESQTPAAVRLKDKIKGLAEGEKLGRMIAAVDPIQRFERFYAELVRQGKDAAYYGATVTPKDADKVLLRWKLSDKEYRVIFGDLHVETVSPERLAQVEATQVKPAPTESADADREFGNPTNLGPLVNTSANEYDSSISDDGLELYFNSPRPGGLGQADIWVTTRKTKSAPWGEPVNLGPTVNSPVGDGGPSISADGLSLYFGSDRAGGYGGMDLWVTTRKTKADPWGTPVNLGATVNGPANEGGPSISADELTLYFSDNHRRTQPDRERPGGLGNGDIWATTRKTKADPWGTPVNLGPTVNSPLRDQSPSISGDGLSLYFSVELYYDPASGEGNSAIYVTKRKSTTEPWGTPVKLGPAVNAEWELNPDISRDGSTLYFAAGRQGGVGGIDLWQVTLKENRERQ